jgi:hypothetical protein
MRTEVTQRRVLLIFLDGVGIGTRDPLRNPLFARRPPFLSALLGDLPSLGRREVESGEALCIPADANLGVAGLPQSGTGQSTLYTGINTARIIRQHFGPYLYSTLKPVVEKHNLFEQLLRADADVRVALANAFPQPFFNYLQGPRRRIVAGMFAALTAGIPFRDIEALKNRVAVSTDLTAERWAGIGHPEAPVITPYEAGIVLAGVADQNDLTLFEYFLTDKAGHERNMDLATSTLRNVDDMLRGVYDHVDLTRTLVVVTSDHGNVEEIGIKTHTRHPVPVILFGNRRDFPVRSITSISHLVPAIRSFLQG